MSVISQTLFGSNNFKNLSTVEKIEEIYKMMESEIIVLVVTVSFQHCGHTPHCGAHFMFNKQTALEMC